MQVGRAGRDRWRFGCYIARKQLARRCRARRESSAPSRGRYPVAAGGRGETKSPPKILGGLSNGAQKIRGYCFGVGAFAPSASGFVVAVVPLVSRQRRGLGS